MSDIYYFAKRAGGCSLKITKGRYYASVSTINNGNFIRISKTDYEFINSMARTKDCFTSNGHCVNF
ncbi:hypothetical protein vBAbaPP1_165 [Acinetobacter phage vB_AbaM_P1]|nr:hypothetical protein vBAbaPP1_165 [Acinetobacter phage vB_AbaM_P1]WAX22648.1 hypothetical protein [Acinetobacter phage vB_AbaP_HB01]